eukprot:12902460-Ditylum_brightwellii.AAC.2
MSIREPLSDSMKKGLDHRQGHRVVMKGTEGGEKISVSSLTKIGKTKGDMFPSFKLKRGAMFVAAIMLVAMYRTSHKCL